MPYWSTPAWMPRGMPGRAMPNGLMPTFTHGFFWCVCRSSSATKPSMLLRRQSARSSLPPPSR